MKARHNFLLRRALRCRGDWIRTSDLLNPIQELTQPNRLTQKADAPIQASACTAACTSDGETTNADVLAALAAKIAALSLTDRSRLDAMLAMHESVTATPCIAPATSGNAQKDKMTAHFQ
jgi:hypothetical protein